MNATVSSYADDDAAYRRDTCAGDEPPSFAEQVDDLLAEIGRLPLAMRPDLLASLSDELRAAVAAEIETANRTVPEAIVATADEARERMRMRMGKVA